VAAVQPVEAARSLRAALTRDPLLAEALLELGRMARRRANGSLARSYLDRAVVANPHLRAARLELAELLLELGEHGAAQEQFQEALIREPASLRALAGRARAAVELASKDSEIYLEALRLRGERMLADGLAARLLMARGEWRKAAEQLGRLAGRPGSSPEATLWLAQSLLQVGDLAAAEVAFEQAAERSWEACQDPAPGGVGCARAAEVHLGLSQLDLRRGRLGTALLHATAARDLLSGHIHPVSVRAAVKLQLARCHRLNDSMGAAIAELQDVLELDRQNLAARRELARIYAGLGKRARAVQELAAALRQVPDSREVRSELLSLCQGQPLEGCPGGR
jgi:tetratricopeptide (TPR) repeat protein